MIQFHLREGVRTNQVIRAFSRIELIVVIGVIVILVGVLWPTFQHKRGVPAGVVCMNNLKQIGLSFRIFASEHNDKFPMQLPVTNAGAASFRAIGNPASYFLIASDELSTPLILTCPADTRLPAKNWDGLMNENISYFLSTSAAPKMTNAIMAGDRDLRVSGRPVGSGLLDLTTNTQLGWGNEMHSKACGAPCGNLLFTDGSVETAKAHFVLGTWTARRYRPDASVETVREDLSHAVQNQGLLTNRLSIP